MVSSCNQEVVSGIQVHDEDVMEVQPMEVDVAKDLFLKKLRKRGRANTDDVVRLMTLLTLCRWWSVKLPHTSAGALRE